MNARAAPPIFETFGCRLNAYETEGMKRMAEAGGLEGAVVVNTCAVTAEAVRQARQRIRRLRRENPGARLIVTGCAAQTEPETFAAMPEVDLVLGNAEKMRPEAWTPDFIGAAQRVTVEDIFAARETSGHMLDGFGARSRAHVMIQNGCDHRCTFCVIPFGRGDSRSAAAGEVVEQVRRLVAAGYNEVVLTGVDLTSWGADLPGAPRLGALVRRILRLVPELPRLRLSSIDSVEADEDLLAAFAEEPRLMPHLHLSLQAGDDMILKRMKRRHLRADAIGFCARLRALRPGMTFGADLIAGFPTETEDMFGNTLDLVEACGLTWLHVFPYSARSGTPAARMPQVAKPVRLERAARLRALGDRRAAAWARSRIGGREACVVETPRTGRTEGFAEIAFAEARAPGALTEAVVAGADGARLVAAPA
ncbi:tRNA (N(6)-L-threonylcarbamoyladenosine(37)-C(2))-methylthiotransferase MtaB [Rubrimonas cliftonensis]|uniref:Threonylcarbamoyladenosine tRNA methylthiotransferase MtaB n=1 Tax=Rubrimonas cliftonensis TaxID=89524 RepID=A0A1H3XNI1_9RHOB|nr:tRNA (N(6)-L-threonylcarbamoyladenosine(37)-C(2))-methylthiotransferase MtaB [Rubrimonas cliftonensis]SEA00997.1 threonylcarbamoyladenosine tRNA methylthiotransferase MtaB [Rubrimonas cliftonensis]